MRLAVRPLSARTATLAGPTLILPVPDHYVARPAVPDDGPALAALERLSPIVAGDVSVVYDRGDDGYPSFTSRSRRRRAGLAGRSADARGTCFAARNRACSRFAAPRSRACSTSLTARVVTSNAGRSPLTRDIVGAATLTGHYSNGDAQEGQ